MEQSNEKMVVMVTPGSLKADYMEKVIAAIIQDPDDKMKENPMVGFAMALTVPMILDKLDQVIFEEER